MLFQPFREMEAGFPSNSTVALKTSRIQGRPVYLVKNTGGSMELVGIVGLGSVGSAVSIGLQIHHDVVGYDIDGRGDWNEILRTKAVFICVPTDGLDSGELDTSIVRDVVSRLDHSNYSGLVIVKSTLHPGTMDRLSGEYPGRRLVYMPEFLREKDAVDWFQNPDRLIGAGNPLDVEDSLALFEWVPPQIPRLRMSFLDAELGKLAHNAYIATKVTFTNEIERIAIHLGADSKNVMESVWQDRRVNNSAHLTPGLGGFEGKCVPKDTRALSSVDPDCNSILHHLHERGSNDAIRQRLKNDKH